MWYWYGVVFVCLATCVLMVIDERRFKKVSPYILSNSQRKKIKIVLISLMIGLLWPFEVCFGIAILLYLVLIKEPKKDQGAFLPPEECDDIIKATEI